MKNPENIIIRMPNWIGDLVMATPVLADLRARFPDAKITAMASHPIAHVLDNDPSIDELFCFHHLSGPVRRNPGRNTIDRLVTGKYDLGILLTNSFSSAWRFWQGRVNRRIGFRGDFRSLLLTDPISFPEKRKEQHLVKTYKALLAPLGIEESKTPPKLYVDAEEIKEAKKLLESFGVEKGEVVVGINPGAAYGSAKCWPQERFREVAEKLIALDKRVRVLFFGSGEGVSLVKEICNGLPPQVVNLAGTTSIRELMALISSCDLFITNDSGPMHIADALNIPLIALFGSTDPVVTGPYRQFGGVICKAVDCSPCFKRVCPIDFRCMTRIGVEEVYAKAKQCLATRLTH